MAGRREFRVPFERRPRRRRTNTLGRVSPIFGAFLCALASQLADVSACDFGFERLHATSSICIQYWSFLWYTRADAVAHCALGGHQLVSILSEADNNALADKIRYNDARVWIGLQKVGGERTWDDGSPVLYEGWGSANGDCYHMAVDNDDVAWSSAGGCGEYLNFVCGHTFCNDGQFCGNGDPEPCGGVQYYCQDGIRHTVSPGYFGTSPDGNVLRQTGQAQCDSVGHYCADGIKQPCPQGRYGSVASVTWDDLCEGPCSAGHFCPAGSVRSNATSCGSPSQYCPAGAVTPVQVGTGNYSVPRNAPFNAVGEEPCEAGYFCVGGERQACPAGRYGTAKGLHSAACSDACPAGYYCPSASTSGTEHRCGTPTVYCPANSAAPLDVPAGHYSLGGTENTRTTVLQCEPGYYCVNALRRQCPAGRYGGEFGETDTTCTSQCQDGFDCPTGASDQYARPCLSDVSSTYCSRGVQRFVASGNYSVSTSVLLPGGSVVKVNVGEAACDPGYYCVSGQRLDCQAGFYTALAGQTSCTTSCTAGFYCPAASPAPVPCGLASFYCPPGIGSPVPVSIGFYSTEDQTAQIECEPGFWCEHGVRYACPDGYFLEGSGASQDNCQPCSAGCVCPTGAETHCSQPCRDPQYFCPAGSVTPIVVGDGYFGVAQSITDADGAAISVYVDQSTCQAGSFCAGGISKPCPAGRYTVSPRATVCTELCSAGFFCDQGSTNGFSAPCQSPAYYCPQGTPVQVPVPAGMQAIGESIQGHSVYTSIQRCPQGFWCAGGVSQACQDGFVADSEALPGPWCDGPCPEGRWCSRQDAVGIQDCGHAGVFCPRGSSSPTLVPEGYVATSAVYDEVTPLLGPVAFASRAEASAAGITLSSVSVDSTCQFVSAAPAAHVDTDGGIFLPTMSAEVGALLRFQVSVCTVGNAHATANVSVDVSLDRDTMVTAVTQQATSAETQVHLALPAAEFLDIVIRASGLTAIAVDSLSVVQLVPNVTVEPVRGAALQVCGGASYFCTNGVRSLVPAGWYSTGGSGPTTRSAALVCEEGYYCPGTGLRVQCPAGAECPIGSSAPNTARCSLPAYYCPESASAALTVSRGFVAVAAVAGDTNIGQTECGSSAHFCLDGVRTAVRAGYVGVGSSATTQYGEAPCGSVSHFCIGGSKYEASPGYATTGGLEDKRTAQKACLLSNQFCAGGVAIDVANGRYSLPIGEGTPRTHDEICPAGHYCTHGDLVPCPAGRYSLTTGSSDSAVCTPCPAGTYSPQVAQNSSDACTRCQAPEWSEAGASECWPGLLSVSASESLRLSSQHAAGLSRGDTLRFTFTKAVDRVDWSTVDVAAFLETNVPVALSWIGLWGADSTELAVEINDVDPRADAHESAIGRLSVSLRSDTVSVRSASRLSHGIRTLHPVLVQNGTWGRHAAPTISSILAFDGEPRNDFLGIGDYIDIRFDQQVRGPVVADQVAVDKLLSFSAPIGSRYFGSWIDKFSLRIEVTGAYKGSDIWRQSAAIGTLSVTVLGADPKYLIVALDGDSPPSQAHSIVDSGTWGDVVSHVSASVLSASSLVVTFTPPTTATSYTPGAYLLQWSHDRDFFDDDSVIGSSVVDASTAIIEDLTTGIPVYVRVACDNSGAFGVSAGSEHQFGGWTYLEDGRPVAPVPPTITAIVGGQFLSSAGGELVTIHGDGFGVAGAAASAVYDNGAQRYAAGPCNVESSQTVRCESGPGVGTAFRWSVSINGFASEFSTDSTSFAKPTIADFAGPGSRNAHTAGNQQVIIRGSGFGFESSKIDSAIYSVGGDDDVMFSAHSCQISVPHTEIVCNTSHGAGADLRWVLTIAGQPSTAPFTVYASPVVYQVLPSPGSTVSLAQLSTSGGDRFRVRGDNFGPAAPQLLDFVAYGRGNELFRAASCTVVQEHTELECLTAAGFGAGLRVTVSVHGQLSAPVPEQYAMSYSTPRVDSLSVPSGPTDGGYEIQVIGANFGGAVAAGNVRVLIGGAEAVGLRILSHTQLAITIPAGTGARKYVSVDVAGRRSNEEVFSYNTPEISSIVLQQVLPNRTSLLRIQGSSFGGNMDVVALSIGSMTLHPFHVSHNEIDVWSPVTTGAVVLIVDGQAAVSPGLAGAGGVLLFDLQTLMTRPVIDRISPESSPTRGNTTLTLSGSHFKQSGTVVLTLVRQTELSWRSGVDVLACTVLEWSVDAIRCQLPAGQGRYDVHVTSQGLESPPRSFEFLEPSISSISPQVVGTTPHNITIEGSNFGFGGAVVVMYEAVGRSTPVPCMQRSWTHSFVVCTLAEGAASPLSVRLVTDGGRHASGSAQLRRASPRVDSIDPPVVPTTGGTVISISGSNFGAFGNVTVNGAVCPPVSYSHTIVSCLAPSGTGAINSVLVFNEFFSSPLSGAGSGNLAYASPQVASLVWSSAPSIGGFDLMVEGSGFGYAIADVAVRVSLDDGSQPRDCSVLSASDSLLHCIAPPGIGANQSVAVGVADQWSNSVNWLSYDAPVVATVLPNIGNARVGDARSRIVGKNFGAAPPQRGISVILSDGMRCDEVVWLSDAELQCDMPPSGVVGNRTLSVTIHNQTSEGVVVFSQCAQGNFGLPGETCSDCPTGAICSGADREPYPRKGYWRLSRAEFLICTPADACPGGEASPCAQGYEGEACSECANRYYRLRKVCEPCPDTGWVMIVVFFLAIVTMLSLAMYMNKRRINLAGLSIGVDFLQVCSMFASFDFSWPPELRVVFNAVSASNFNIDIAAPQCAMPGFDFTTKFTITQLLPVALAGFVACTWAISRLGLAAKHCCQRYVHSKKGNDLSKKLTEGAIRSVNDMAIGTSFTAIYYLYFVVVNSALAVFDCNPNTNGKVTMDAEPSIECGHGVHAVMRPFAVVSLLVYGVGIPATFGIVVWRFREQIKFDQTLRSRGEGDNAFSNPAYYIRRRYRKLYEDFKPAAYYWRFVLLFRKFGLAAVSLMFSHNPMFQASVSIGVIFASYIVHVKYQPFLPRASVSQTFVDLAKSTSKQATVGRRQSLMLLSHKAASSKTAQYTFDYNKLESGFLVTAQLLLLGGMVFQSAAFVPGTVGYITLIVLLIGIIGASVAAFTLMLVFEMYRSFKFSAVLERARRMEKDAHKDAHNAKKFARMLQGRGPRVSHGVEMPNSRKSWRNLLANVDSSLDGKESPKNGKDSLGSVATRANPLYKHSSAVRTSRAVSTSRSARAAIVSQVQREADDAAKA